MSVVSVKLSWSDQRSRITSDGVEAQLVYTATTDSPSDGADVVRNDPRIPHLGQPHPRDARLGCVDVDPQPLGPMYWEIPCHFESPGVSGRDKSVLDAAALVAEAPEISWDDEETQELIDYDIYGVPLVNSVNEPFDPPPTHTFRDEVLRVTRYEGSYDPRESRIYVSRGSVNADPFQFAKPGECLMTKRAGQPVLLPSNNLVWKVNYEFKFRQPAEDEDSILAWQWRFLNRGHRYWTGDTVGGLPDYREPLDDTGNKLTETVLLDIDGTRLPAGKKPVWIRRLRYPARPFARWQFPQNLYGAARKT